MSKNAVTPLMLDMATHYFVHSFADYPLILENEVRREQAEFLVEAGILAHSVEPGNTHYRITEKGTAWLEMILATPFPVQRWVAP